MKLPAVTLFGDIELTTYEGGDAALVLHTAGGLEVLTVHLAQPPRALGEEEVFIRDYSEHAGLAPWLEEIGLVKIQDRFTVGRFRSGICVAKLLQQ